MVYTVEFSARANRDIDKIVARIQADAPTRATQWRQKLHIRGWQPLLASFEVNALFS